MFDQNRYFKLCVALIVSGVLSCGVRAYAEIAQGDGDPDEVVPAELPVGNNSESTEAPDSGAPISDIPDLRSDEQGETAENAVATVTADGDFLLPTYLLPGETATVTRKTVVEEVVEEPVVKTMEEKTTVTRSVSEVVDETAPADVDILAEIQATNALPAPKPARNIGTGHVVPARKVEQPPRRLLLPLAPVTKAAEADPVLPPRVRAVAPSAYADQILDSLEKGEPLAFLMPRDLKISFYPHESSFSGQSLKWIKAFAIAALNDPRLVVEIRASCVDAELQDKRLALVKNALQGAGLSTHQIIVNYTKRPVDTMLLRAVPRPETKEVITDKDETKLPKNASRVTKW